MRRLFISADMEGCGAVASQLALAPDRPEWAAARQWMTREVLAIVAPAFQAGYGEVLVADSHGNAHNIDPDQMPDNVRLIRSWPRPLLQMQGVEQHGVDACIFMGYHDAAQGAGGLLAHCYHGGAYRDVRLNGVSCSEGYLNAALAGSHCVPVIMVSGDAATLADAQRYAPGCAQVQTKHAIGARAQSALPPQQICRQLSAAAAQAFSAPAPAPFVIPGPYRLELDMTTQVAAEMLSYLPQVLRLGPFTIAITLGEMDAVMRFVAFAMLYSPVGAVM